jgi:hypothetical protein
MLGPIRELRPDDIQWQRFCDRLTDAVLFVAGQGGAGCLERENIYDALADVFGDEVTPGELERLASAVLGRLRGSAPSKLTTRVS